MRSPVTGIVTLLGLLLVVIVGYMSLFTVQQTEQTIVLQFGKPVDVVTDPGLHFKAPWNSVINIDKRILDLENPSQEAIASDQKRLVVDAFARYRIKDPRRRRRRAQPPVCGSLRQGCRLLRLLPVDDGL
jgi:membrane protease subunit HflC